MRLDGSCLHVGLHQLIGCINVGDFLLVHVHAESNKSPYLLQEEAKYNRQEW